MGNKLLRRTRGEETVRFYTDLAPEVDNVIKRLSADLRLPQWAVIELAIKNLQLDATGKPVGWAIPDPQAEELPISDVA